MSDEYNQTVRKAHAPYNFVPFPKEQPMSRWESVEDLPSHDRIDPKLKTGTIRVTLTAETPVFVSDGNKTDEKSDPHFVKNAAGKYCIPGSTIRGMLRENMHILSFAPMRAGEDIDKRRLLYRNIAGKSGGADESSHENYKIILGVASKKGKQEKNISVLKNVKWGYLVHDAKGWEIIPTKGKYIPINRKDNKNIENIPDLEERVASVSEINYSDGADTIIESKEHIPGMKHGVLVFPGNMKVDVREKGQKVIDPLTGKPMKKKTAIYVFPEKDKNATPIGLNDEDILIYEEDYKDRKNSLSFHSDGKLDFWALPKLGEDKPVFYIHCGGHTYIGMSPFLRIGCDHDVIEGLPKTDNDVLDYPRAMMGFATDTLSYRSRIGVEDFPVQAEQKELPDVPMVLGEPRPSYYKGYVEEGKDYCQKDFKLRGYKQYWLKPEEIPPYDPEKLKVLSHIRPLPKGTAFAGTIHYKNLSVDELGLLLWALRLEPGCYQTIGQAKPYGYGRMKLTIDALEEYQPEQLYSLDSFDVKPLSSTEKQIQDYIEEYQHRASQHLDKPVMQKGFIQDFFYMHSKIMGQEARYMDLEEYKKIDSPLPTAKDFRDAEHSKTGKSSH